MDPIHPARTARTARAAPFAAWAHFELGVALVLATWPVLTQAVAAGWGGPESVAKRDWLGGVLVEQQREPVGAEEVAAVLDQVMEEEFSVVVEDGSVEEVAARVVALRRMCEEGETGGIVAWYERWRQGAAGANGASGASGAGGGVVGDTVGDTVGETSEDESEGEGWGEG
ncbi:hypothetical protein PORY_001107 [Pneumocystis oryctolagi]|uniref:Uncharacterized protein n=1 Tax=Pneumocystis oryctolagi TaxID=42067 RepID=A0ACB7CCQ5_9ASCO|nr:hypothetical protein PORY_001107 [Pneumocystis oryctolagi]